MSAPVPSSTGSRFAACPACQREITQTLVTCPYCGHETGVRRAEAEDRLTSDDSHTNGDTQAGSWGFVDIAYVGLLLAVGPAVTLALHLIGGVDVVLAVLFGGVAVLAILLSGIALPDAYFLLQAALKTSVMIGSVVALFLVLSAVMGRGAAFVDPEEASPASCTTVPPPVAAVLDSALRVPGVSLTRLRAASSGDAESLLFVAAEIEGPGSEGRGDIGVWAFSSNTAQPPVILSVNALAHDLSTWPYGPDTDAQVSMADAGARQAEACATGR